MGDSVGVSRGTEQVVKGTDPHRGHWRACEGDMARVRMSHGMVEVELS